jgi:superfamily II DNA or RNA helicase
MAREGGYMEPLVPTPEQEGAIKRMVSEPTRAALNASTMGAGKTLKAVEVVKRLDAKTVLLIAPLNTRLGWKVTFERQGVDLPFRWIRNSKDGLSSLEDWEWLQPGIYFVGVEYFVRKAFDQSGKRSGVWSKEADVVLFDEVHRSQNRHSKTYKALKAVKGGFKLAMSGTPTGNSFSGAWAVTKWLWPEIIESSYWRWVDRYCATEYDHFAPQGKKIVGEKNPGEFFNGLPCYIRIESEFDAELVEEQVYVELHRAQRKAYEELQEKMVTWIEEQPIVVEFPIALRIRLRQATLGMFSLDDEDNITFADDCVSAKLDAMFDALENRLDNESCLILTDSRKFADVVVARLRKAGHTAEPWHGHVSQSKREEVKQSFVGGSCKYVVAVISAIAEGVDGMQNGTRNMLWLNRSDNRILNEQAVKRVHRQGQKETVRSIELIAVDTYDQGVLSSQIQNAIEMNKTLREKNAVRDR